MITISLQRSLQPAAELPHQTRVVDDRRRLRELDRNSSAPVFGTEPDARVLALAGEAADPKAFRVLDVGAGTGRNALGLARRGYPVDAVELTPKFADIVRTEAARELLDVRVIQRDVFATLDDLRQ